MAVQQLAKKQAKKEKKNQKALDDEFERDEEKALEDTQRMIDSMERIYKKGKKEPKPDKSKGKKIEQIEKVPKYWPNSDNIKTDILDYAFEIEYFDSHLVRILNELEKRNLLVWLLSHHQWKTWKKLVKQKLSPI